MGRHKEEPNATCPDCGGGFRKGPKCKLIRCPVCRKGKQGNRLGGRKTSDKCKCGNKKGFSSGTCRECYRKRMAVDTPANSGELERETWAEKYM